MTDRSEPPTPEPPAPEPPPAVPLEPLEPPEPPPAPAPSTWGAPLAPVGPRPSASGSIPGWIPGKAPVTKAPGPRPTGWRTTLAVAGIMIGVVFGVNIVNATVPLPQEPATVDPGPGLPQDPGQPLPTNDPVRPQDPGGTPLPAETKVPVETAPPVPTGPVSQGAGVEVGGGFVIFPPDGWTIVGGEQGLTVFQKGGVLFVVGGLEWGGTPAELASGYRDAWFAGGELTGDDPQAGTVGNGIPAASLTYTGVVNGTQVDGAIVAGTAGGSGFLFNLFGSTGTLSGVGGDIDQILATVQHAGG